MKKLKKVFAVLLSVAMILGMSSTVFADAEPGEPSTGGNPPAGANPPSATAHVQNVDPGSELTAYQIVSYDPTGKYVNKVTGKPSDLSHPTQEEILSLAAQIRDANGNGFTKIENNNWIYDATAKEYTTTKLEAGMWIILIKGGGKTIYNPLVVSVDMTKDGKDCGTVDANGNFMGSPNFYAKHSDPTVEKTVDPITHEGDEEFTFTVNATIPSYTSAYKNIQYKIKDELSSNLEYVTNGNALKELSVTLGNSDISDKVTVSGIDSKSVTFDFSTNATRNNDEWLQTNGGSTITITYKAKLTEEAQKGLTDAVTLSNNKVTLEYSNNPSQSSDTTKKMDKTTQYTFGIDANVMGDSEHKWSETTGEFFKVDETGKVEYNETKKEFEQVIQGGHTLAGAEFQLHKGTPTGELFTMLKEDGTTQDTFTTTADGRLKIVGLDADTTYYLEETKAPQGYSKVDTIVKIKIDAKLKEQNETITVGGESYEVSYKKLTDYSVKMQEGKANGEAFTSTGDEVVTATYTVKQGTNTTTGEDTITIDPTVKNPFNFKNTKLGELPSTGGIGTIIFTVGGCLIMVVAAALYFANRRKAANSESK